MRENEMLASVEPDGSPRQSSKASEASRYGEPPRGSELDMMRKLTELVGLDEWGDLKPFRGDHGNWLWLLSELGAAGWLPIETAPKDGTPILIFEGDDDLPWVDVACNYFDIDHNPADDRWFARQGNEISCHNPTHWRPLPAPPHSDRVIE